MSVTSCGLPQIITRSHSASSGGSAKSLNNFPELDEVGDAALVVERLARDRRIVPQGGSDQFAEKLVLRQFGLDEVAIGELGLGAHAMHEDNRREPFVGLSIADRCEERREAGFGCEKVQVASVAQIVENERAGRLAADEDAVAGRQMLQVRSQRTVLNLDREELEFLSIVGGSDRISAHQRTALDLKAKHHELPVLETAGGVAGCLETEQGVRPVANVQNPLLELTACLPQFLAC